MDIRKGAVHINITTIGPNVATELDKLHSEKGAYYIAAPVRIFLRGERVK